jgi:carbamoyl-phosphate synthase large subunit
VDFNILLSSAGRRVALLNIFRKSLRDLGLEGRVLAADASPLAPALFVADGAARVPPCTAPGFVQEMIDLCERERVRLLIPTVDPELPVLASARDQFAAIGCTVALSSIETVLIGCNKRQTHQFLTAHRLPRVQQFELAEVLAAPKNLPYPLIVKPVVGSASIGVQVIHDERALSSANGDVVVQALALGDEYTVDVLVDREGRCRCAVPRRRIEVRAGEVSKGVTVRDEPLIRLANDVVQSLPGAFGVLNLQVFIDPVDGAQRIIEINPRFGGGYPLADAAGARMARWLIEIVLGAEPRIAAESWREGLLMLRYDDAIFVEQTAETRPRE